MKMKSFTNCIKEYKKQMEEGSIPLAYKGLMEYIMSLRTYFKNKYPDYFVPGNIYFGYMDMTYFSIIPKSLKSKRLKIAVVFIHEKVKFEVWLSGYNKQIQKKYWNLFKKKDLKIYRVPSNLEGVDSIVEYDLVANPDFDDLKTLTKQIEGEVLRFIYNIEKYLNK